MSVTTNCVLRINLDNYGIATRGLHIIWLGILNRRNRFVNIRLQKFPNEGGDDYGTGQTGCSTIFMKIGQNCRFLKNLSILGDHFAPLL